MEQEVTTEMSENEDAQKSSSSTSGQKKSQPRIGKDIPLEGHLEILQLAAYDYQKNGGKIKPIKLDKVRGIALVLEGVDFVNGRLVLIAEPEKQNLQETPVAA